MILEGGKAMVGSDMIYVVHVINAVVVLIGVVLLGYGFRRHRNWKKVLKAAMSSYHRSPEETKLLFETSEHFLIKKEVRNLMVTGIILIVFPILFSVFLMP